MLVKQKLLKSTILAKNVQFGIKLYACHDADVLSTRNIAKEKERFFSISQMSVNNGNSIRLKNTGRGYSIESLQKIAGTFVISFVGI